MPTISRKTLVIYRRTLCVMGAMAVLYLALNLD
ncbi:hypothetical protein CTP10_R71350 (plasmid) [Cupriavidus sp. P-10]|nr:hypothetical protein CTP10_R71350 [Cupriavidus sp. P-10]